MARPRAQHELRVAADADERAPDAAEHLAGLRVPRRGGAGRASSAFPATHAHRVEPRREGSRGRRPRLHEQTTPEGCNSTGATRG